MLVLNGLNDRDNEDWKQLHELETGLLPARLCVQQFVKALECNPLFSFQLVDHYEDQVPPLLGS